MSGPSSFLRRWSRLKFQAAAAAGTAPALPPMDTLDFNADFSPFMRPEVDGATRKDALRKLFMTDHYRVMDGLDVYVEDYSRPVELPAELLGTLDHAQVMLEPADDKAAELLPERPEQA